LAAYATAHLPLYSDDIAIVMELYSYCVINAGVPVFYNPFNSRTTSEKLLGTNH